MMGAYRSLLILWILFSIVNCSANWIWKCENGYCLKESIQSAREGFSSMELCQLVCSNYLNVWPKPTGISKSSKEAINVNTNSINVTCNGPNNTIHYTRRLISYFEEKLKREEPFQCDENTYNLKIFLNPSSNDTKLHADTKESYSLTIHIKDQNLIVNISAPTVFGIRHGLETFAQILIPHVDDGFKCLSTVSSAEITDEPMFSHRGLLIDTARNYLSVDTIKRQIEGMALSKLNVLHWHITDSQSFPLVSSRLPNMTKFGAYSPTKIYTKEAIEDIISFAEIRGVRILFEIDGPSHAGMGWQWGKEAGLGNLAVCVNKQPWRSYCIEPPCGQLNPVNPHLYEILTKLYSDVNDLSTDLDMFHMGGDEVYIPCWNSTAEILKYLKGKPLTEETYLDLWAEYQQKNLAAFDEAVGHSTTPIVVWTSSLTDLSVIQKYLPNNRYIIQTWVEEKQISLITNLTKLGYKVIISTKDRWYLDHGFWGTWEYHKWQKVYENKMYEKYSKAILGGEVCMWGEYVDDNNIDSRVWPRAAAAAERMWSYPLTSAKDAQFRLVAHGKRLTKRGIKSEALIPEWCVQNEGECI